MFMHRLNESYLHLLFSRRSSATFGTLFPSCFTVSQKKRHPPIIFVALSQTHTFNGPFSRTTQVGWYQKGKTKLDFTEARDSEWQWHQLGHMQVCTSFQTDNHASTLPLRFYRPDALPAAQPTASKHWRQNVALSQNEQILLNLVHIILKTFDIGSYALIHHTWKILYTTLWNAELFAPDQSYMISCQN